MAALAPLTWKDWLKMTIGTGGTGALVVGAASSGFQAFVAGDDAKKFSYSIQDGTAWETGIGTYTHSGTSFARTVRTDSSTGGALNVTTNALLFVDAFSTNLAGYDAAQVGFINGLIPKWVSTTQLGVTPGACYIESLGYVVSGAPADITPSSPSASTWYHVYAFISGSTLTIEASTTAPVAFATAFGVARSKGSDTTRRFLYSVMTDGASHFYRFSCDQSGIWKWSSALDATPFRVLAAGTATSSTSVDCSGVVPSTSLIVLAFVQNLSTTAQIYIGSNDYTVSTTMFSTSIPPAGAANDVGTLIMAQCTSAQLINYINVGAAPSTYIDIHGFMLQR